MGKNGGGKLSQWAKIKIVCKVVRGKLQKAHTMGYLTVPGQESGRGLSRLSSSCPSLNVDGEELDDDDSPSCSEEFLDTRKGRTSSTSECHRRRSWSGLSDEEKKRARHRSISLSSLDSDAEEAFYDAEDSTNTQGSDSVDGGCRRAVEKQRSMSGSSSPVTYGGGSSTHSLNDVHLQEKRSSGPIEKPRLLAPRLTLQKSVSTPSILAGVTTQPPQQQQTQSSYQYEDDSSNKRRKRGSIFFRKKKDKTKKSSHQFVSVCYSNSATCDVCSKPMTNKPALRCE
ncbi:hypothetical protein OTU49_017410, partial [Cherax quadricarinatus]